MRAVQAIAVSMLIAFSAPLYAQAMAATTNAEVRKVDRDAKKITLKHEAITNLDMPAMTMVFQVRDMSMLDQVKAGDRVKFSAEKVDGAYVLTKLEAAK